MEYNQANSQKNSPMEGRFQAFDRFPSWSDGMTNPFPGHAFLLSRLRVLQVGLCLGGLLAFATTTQAEYLVRNRAEPELKQQMHRILQKMLGEEYVDVSVQRHALIDTNLRKRDSDVVPGVQIMTRPEEANVVFSYRTITVVAKTEVDLDVIEARLRNDVKLDLQDRFELSVVLGLVKIERPDFSQKLVDYVNLLVAARDDLRGGKSADARTKLQQAAEISAKFPNGYEMLGVEKLIPEYRSETLEQISIQEMIFAGLLGFLILLLLVFFFFVSRSTRKDDVEEKQHPLQPALGKVAEAIESMKPEEETEDEGLPLAEEEAAEGGEREDHLRFLKALPPTDRTNLIKTLQNKDRAVVLSQIDLVDASHVLKTLPPEEAFVVLHQMRNVAISEKKLQELGEKLAETAKTLEQQFDALGRIGELSGQLETERWQQILASAEALQTKHPEKKEQVGGALQELQAKGVTFGQLHERSEVDHALLGRVMERFERSKLSNGGRVSVQYVLFEAEPQFQEMLLSEFTEDTRQFYQEQLEQLQQQASEDEDALARIEQMRDLHRSLFMRLVHNELNRLPTTTNQEE